MDFEYFLSSMLLFLTTIVKGEQSFFGKQEHVRTALVFCHAQSPFHRNSWSKPQSIIIVWDIREHRPTKGFSSRLPMPRGICHIRQARGFVRLGSGLPSERAGVKWYEGMVKNISITSSYREAFILVLISQFFSENNWFLIMVFRTSKWIIESFSPPSVGTCMSG